MKRLILCVLIFSAALEASAQELQFSQPVKLSSAINTEDEELAPMLSPDGQTLYFSRAFHNKNTGGKYAGTDIWISRKDADGNWTPAVNAGKPWNTKRSNAVIGISADGATVYLTNAYNNKSGFSFSRLVLGKWTKPEFIAVPGINRDDLVGIYVHPASDVMMISMKGKDNNDEEDLYVSLKDSLGRWSQPRTLGSSINTSGFEISPFLSRDKKRLYFSSNGHSGFGDADIFYSDRLYDSWQTWTVPINLDEKVNSVGFDAFFSIYGDSVAYFTSNRIGKSTDIFTVEVKTSATPFKISEKFMTQSDMKSVLGGEISSSITYVNNETQLSQEQQERVWYIANKVELNRDINIYLRVLSEDSADLMSQRITVIFDLLKLAGIETPRIHVDYKAQVKGQENGIIELLFFK